MAYSNVTLTLLRIHKEKALEIIEQVEGEAPYDEWDDEQNCCSLEFETVKNGDLNSLPHLLNAGIPFISAWESAGEYGAGTDYGWFTKDGDQQTKRVYEEDHPPRLNTTD